MAESCQYDFFISYADDGRAWVNGELLPKLHRAAKKCLREEDFESGKQWLPAMQEAITQSHKVLLVLTPQYLASREKEFIKIMGFTWGAEQRDWPVVPILIKPIDRELLLRSIGAVDLTDIGQEDAFAKLLHDEGIVEAGQKEQIAPPYPGMVPFSESDARIFFGREDKIAECVDYLYTNRLLVLFGPSGCGKSSLAAAGIIPKLRQSHHLFGEGEWLVKRFRPSEQPFLALVKQYGEAVFSEPEKLVEAILHEQAGASRLLLFIDQCEEMFALDGHGAETPKRGRLGAQAQTFMRHLAILAKQKNVFLILTIREEFFPQLAWYEEWPDLYRYGQAVGFLGHKGLADAIRKPAEKNGGWLDDVLVERLVNDAGDEPGILPFVQETMRKLWGMMDERYLSIKDYEKLDAKDGVSGLKYAITAKADSAFKSLPSDAHRNIARRIFIRLVQFGEGKPDTRRQQPLSALRSEQEPPGVFDETLAHLSSEEYRLLIRSGEGEDANIDLVHESIIDVWLKRQGWMDDLAGLEKVRRNLLEKALEWKNLNFSAGYMDSVQIENARCWLNKAIYSAGGGGSLIENYIVASQNKIKSDSRLRMYKQIGFFFLALFFVFMSVFSYFQGLRIMAKYNNPLISIKGGDFFIGGDIKSGLPAPIKKVNNIKDFSMEKFEVTNSQYCLCLKSGVCKEVPYACNAIPDLPIESISLIEADQYCKWLGRRLPTEVEWERAAAGEERRKFPVGDRVNPHDVNINSVNNSAVSVFSLKDETPEGIRGLTGNVSEWTISLVKDYSDYTGAEFYRDHEVDENLSKIFIVRGGEYTADETWAYSSHRESLLSIVKCATGYTQGRGT